MRFAKLIIIASLSTVLSLPACGSHVEIAPPEGGEPGDGGSGGGGHGGNGGGAVQGLCADACATTADDGCFKSADCVDYCETNVSTWAPEVAEAFATCAAENPLCFETVPNCILKQLHPMGTSHSVRLEGSGFDAYDGMRLFVWNDPGANMPFGGDMIISNGKFAFDWFEPVAVGDNGTSLLLLYIDIDGNGMCNAAADMTAPVTPQWNGEYLNPAFVAMLAPPLADSDFVCSFPP